MASAGRHNDRAVTFDLRAMTVDNDLALTFFDAKKLVAVVVDFFSDLAAGLDRHQDQLEVLACIEDSPEIIIFLGQLLDICYKAFHLELPKLCAEARLTYGNQFLK